MVDKNNDKAHDHEYDGIVEQNNPPPYWIILVLILTVGFSMVYVIKYFGYPENGNDQKSEYEQSIASYELEKANTKDSTAKGSILTENQMVAAGKKLYDEKGCIACHGANGEGNAVGPNLTDDTWLNGCNEDPIVDIIANGKPEKGMTAFKNSLSDNQIRQVAKYILVSLVGSNPANPKAEQGEPCR